MQLKYISEEWYKYVERAVWNKKLESEAWHFVV